MAGFELFLGAKVLEKYKLGQKIGKGHFGVVREAIERETGRVYACKIVVKNGVTKAMQLREIEIALDLSNDAEMGFPGIVRTVEAFEDKHRIYVIMDLARGGTLADYIDRRREAWVAELAGLKGTSEQKTRRGPESQRLGFKAIQKVREQRRDLVEVEAAWILDQLARALMETHARGVLHRDMKPENVLLSEAVPIGGWASGVPPPSSHITRTTSASEQRKPRGTRHLLQRILTSRSGSRVRHEEDSLAEAARPRFQRVMLADFGLAERIPEGGTASTGFVGSPAFVAPEVVQGDAVGFPSDVWGLGVILYCLLTDGRLPFTGRSPAMLLRNIRTAELDVSSPALLGVSTAAKDVLRALLAADPLKRPTAAEIAELAWVKEKCQEVEGLRRQH